jgi:sugar fermentation stimulation protein A
VVLADGSVVTVHCANPGSMLGVSRPGSRVRISRAENPQRKLPWTLETIRVGRTWVGVHPVRANPVVEEALRRGRIEPLADYPTVDREVPLAGRRVDFRLRGPGRPPLWIEVKYATWAVGDLALFPDSVSERALQHLALLESRVRAGDAAALLLVTGRADVARIGPADGIDPRYGRALRTARRRGVQILAYRMRVRRTGLTMGSRLRLDPGPHPATAPSTA